MKRILNAFCTLLICLISFQSNGQKAHGSQKPCNIIISKIGITNKYFVPILITTCTNIFNKNDKTHKKYYVPFDVLEVDSATFNVILHYALNYINNNKDSCKQESEPDSWYSYSVEIIGDGKWVPNKTPSLYWHNLRNTAESEKYFLDLINALKKDISGTGMNIHTSNTIMVIDKILERIVDEIIKNKETY